MKKKKIAVIAAIVAAVVILGGIATYVYVFKNNHSAPEIKDGVTDTQSSWNTDTHHIAAGNGGYYYTQYDADGKIRLYYTQVENETGHTTPSIQNIGPDETVHAFPPSPLP